MCNDKNLILYDGKNWNNYTPKYLIGKLKLVVASAKKREKLMN